MNIGEAKGLTKKFGTFVAVDNVSFEIKEGEILGFLGPNGAGKTTTIQMLLGVLTPTSGDVTFFGKNLRTHREEILERINFSTTYTNLPWKLSVKENLIAISYLYDIKDRKKQLDTVVELFKLEDILDLEMHMLSAGQLTRVNLAKAFINIPDILLLDEPTASLDPDIADYVRNLLLEQRDRFGLSILFTSHNMMEVEKVCDRVIFINHGKVIANDTPDNLAKSMKTAHMELRIKDGLKRVIELSDKHTLPHHEDNRYITIDIDEKQIPYFLKSIVDEGIEYDEISIEKPTLEDYFIMEAKKKRPESK